MLVSRFIVLNSRWLTSVMEMGPGSTGATTSAGEPTACRAHKHKHHCGIKHSRPHTSAQCKV